MSDFSWDTEEENEEIWESTAEPPAPPSRSRPWVLLLLVVLTLAGGWLLYRQVNDRIDAAVVEAKEGVLAGHGIVWQAHQQRDSELLGNVLSGRDVEWVSSQFIILEQGLLFGRPFLSLEMAPVSRPITTADITISPDLTHATATLRLPYTPVMTNTIASDPITLAHTAVYRRGTDRWLLSPLDGPAWEATETLDTVYLTVRYPPADADLVERLSGDLTQTISDVCNRYFDLNCGPANTRFNLTFSARPETILAAEKSTQTERQTTNMILPTPTLMGRPVDDNAYRALYRGYARLIAADLLDRSLLEEWADRGYDEIYTTARRIRPVQLGWVDAPPAPDTPLTAVETPQEVALLCLERDNTTLMQFDPRRSQLQPLLPSSRRLVSLQTSPTDDGLALRESWQPRGDNPAIERLLVWPFATERPLELQFLPHGEQDEIMWRSHPQQPRLLLEPPQIGSDAPDIVGFQFQSCTADGCEIVTETFSSRHIAWSPDGTHTLLTTDDGHLFLGDENGDPIRYIDVGRQPFWVDNELFRYMQLTGTGRAAVTALYTGQTAQVTPTLSITPADLLSSLQSVNREASAPADDLMFIHTDRVTDNPQQTVVVAIRRDSMNAGLYMWRYDHRTDAVDFLLHRTNVNRFLPSPDGRFMLLTAAEAGEATAEVYDSHTGQVSRYPIDHAGQAVLDWTSTDGWFLILAEGVLTIGRPAEQIEYVMRPDNLGGCFDAGWIHSPTDS